MKLSRIATELDLELASEGPIDDEVEITSGYVCDLLSQVLGSATNNSIWITVQSHMNIIGVAVMSGIKAIIVSEGHNLPTEVINKADEERIVLFKSQANGFQLAGKLYQLGIK